METVALDHAVLDELLARVGGDREFLSELIETYLDDAPNLIRTMREAVATGDAAALRNAAHTLKSNSAGFGAATLAQLSRELETQGRAGSTAGAQAQVRQVEAEYERVQQALSSVRGMA